LASRRDGGRTNGRSSIKPCARYRNGPRRKRRQGSVRIDASKKQQGLVRSTLDRPLRICDALCRHPTKSGVHPAKGESCASRETRYTTYRYGAVVCSTIGRMTVSRYQYRCAHGLSQASSSHVHHLVQDVELARHVIFSLDVHSPREQR
jgi:hypothetical protein